MSEDIEALKNRLRRAEELVELLLNGNPDGILIQEADGRILVNAAASQMVNPGGEVPSDTQGVDRVSRAFKADKVTPVPVEDLPTARAMRGEIVRNDVQFIVTENKPDGVFLEISAVALDGGKRAIATFRDVTERRQLEETLTARNAEVAERGKENQQLVARLRAALDELSTPVLELWDDVLALPVVGLVDTQRSVQMSERLLKEVMERRARYVIVDLTGVEVVDTSTADRFLKLARAVSLLGAECVLTGIQPDVAQTLIELGVDFGGLKTQRNLKRALDVHLGRSVASRA
jgi:rsbT co-antagonist protein RsbR